MILENLVSLTSRDRESNKRRGKKSNDGTIKQRLWPRKGFKGREELKRGKILRELILKEIQKHSSSVCILI